MSRVKKLMGAVFLLTALSTSYAFAWAAKIIYEGRTIEISDSEFEAEFEYVLEANGVPKSKWSEMKNKPMYKSGVIDQMISEVLITMKGDREGFFNTSDAKQFIDIQLRKLKAQYYLSEKYLKKLPDPSEAEIKSIYEKNKARFQEAGKTSLDAEVKAYIIYQIKSGKAELQLKKVVQSLKEAAIIKKNKSKFGEDTDIDMSGIFE